MVKDPVCGMDIDPKKAAATAQHQGQTYYFCSPVCQKKFNEKPSQYVHDHSGHGHDHHHH